MYAQAERIGPSNQKNMLISFSITFFVNVNTMLTKKKKKKKKLPLDAEPFHIPNLKALCDEAHRKAAIVLTR